MSCRTRSALRRAATSRRSSPNWRPKSSGGTPPKVASRPICSCSSTTLAASATSAATRATSVFRSPPRRRSRPPDKQFAAILRDGPSVGVFTIVWCDTLNNLNRSIDRQALREFDLRVLFQMSQNDSSYLVDTPLASKLGPQSALFQNEESGIVEKFRPYAWPTPDFLSFVRGQLSHRLGEPEASAPGALSHSTDPRRTRSLSPRPLARLLRAKGPAPDSPGHRPGSRIAARFSSRPHRAATAGVARYLVHAYSALQWSVMRFSLAQFLLLVPAYVLGMYAAAWWQSTDIGVIQV